ncbi:MAG TPA: PAS domain-containing protein, partial [Chthoniobacteraceae bacterium]
MAHDAVANGDLQGVDAPGILDAVDLPIVVVDRSLKIARFNCAAADALGLTASNLGEPSSDIPALGAMKDYEEACAQVIAGGVSCRRDIRFGDRWYFLRIAPYSSNGAGVSGAVLTFTNVTGFRESLGQAVYEREYTKAILNTVEPLAVLDAELRVRTANRAFYLLFGLSREVIQGARLGDLAADEWKDSKLWPALRALSSNKEVEAAEVKGEFAGLGSRTVLVDARPLTLGGEALILTVFRDVTARKMAEEAVREGEHRFREMLDALPVAIYTTDAEGLLTHFNRAAIELSGREPQLGADRWCITWKLYRPDGTPTPREECSLAMALREGRGIRGTQAIGERPDGTRFWFEPYPTPIFDPKGRLMGGINMLVDITDRKKAEQELERAVRAKDDFLARLSHELRTPLTPVLMMATALETESTLPPDVREHLAMMRRNIQLEARLIDDLLDLTRITCGKLKIDPQVTDLHQILGHTEEIVRSDEQGKQVRVVFQLEAARHHTIADPVRLQQVFWNLVKNALKFTPAGGQVTVRTRNDDAGHVVVSVADTGIGIDGDSLKRIFKAFEQLDVPGQRAHGGLGLGLAISEAIVIAHGGNIRAESKGVGCGATFSVTVTAVEAPAPIEQPEMPPPSPQRSLRLLVVDDHAPTLNVLTRLLTLSGHSVVAVGTMSEALAAATLNT